MTKLSKCGRKVKLAILLLGHSSCFNWWKDCSFHCAWPFAARCCNISSVNTLNLFHTLTFTFHFSSFHCAWHLLHPTAPSPLSKDNPRYFESLSYFYFYFLFFPLYFLVHFHFVLIFTFVYFYSFQCAWHFLHPTAPSLLSKDNPQYFESLDTFTFTFCSLFTLSFTFFNFFFTFTFALFTLIFILVYSSSFHFYF